LVEKLAVQRVASKADTMAQMLADWMADLTVDPRAVRLGD
jgi:hypothetical protein